MAMRCYSSFQMAPLFICVWLSFSWGQNSIKRSAKMKISELSIITVNYNGINDTQMMIESVLSNLTQEVEIIIVDNGSLHDESALLKEKYPFVKAIRSSGNL